jgi:hypothetical protein
LLDPRLAGCCQVPLGAFATPTALEVEVLELVMALTLALRVDERFFNYIANGIYPLVLLTAFCFCPYVP